MTPLFVEQIAPGVFGMALWDEEWRSYNNAYALLDDRGVVLVDAWKGEHQGALRAALGHLGVGVDDVTAVLYTHGHRDHVGGATLFADAAQHIHVADLALLSPEQRTVITGDLPDDGELLGLRCVHWADHTPGSVALHDPRSGVLFAGDPVCFFGEPIPAGLVEEGAGLRAAFLALIASGEARQDPRTEPGRFRTGLRRLAELDAGHLATGHGVVLRGGVPGFLSALADAVQWPAGDG